MPAGERRVHLPAAEAIAAPGPAGPLRGTLQRAADGAAPALLILPGSGPTDRDGNNLLARRGAPYRLLAEGLAARGIASLRADKRGLFASAAATAAPDRVTIADYVADAAAWIAVLRRRLGLSGVWLLGHSEGGLIALAAARRLAGIRGLILVAAPGRPLGAVLRDQLRRNPANRPLLGPAFAAIAALEAGRQVDAGRLPPALARLFRPSVQGFLRSVLACAPAAMLRDWGGPALIVQGRRDAQVGLADALALAAAQGRSRLLVLSRCDHGLRDGTDDRRLAAGLVPAVADFVRAED